MTLVPAILETDIVELNYKLKIAAKFSNTCHIDIGDARFVPVKTPLPAEIQEPPQVEIEWHLMVSQPIKTIGQTGGLNIVHAEIDNLKNVISGLKNQGCSLGLAIKRETLIEPLFDVIDMVNQVTIMSVKPGKQGQPYLGFDIEKIKTIKARFPNVKVEIDGGVSEYTIPEIALSGIDKAIVGSAIWQAADPEAEFIRLTGLLNQVS